VVEVTLRTGGTEGAVIKINICKLCPQ